MGAVQRRACARRRGPARRGRAARRRRRARPRACRSRPGRAAGRRARGGRRAAAPSTAAAWGWGSRAARASGARCLVASPRRGRGRLITVEGLDGAGKTTLVGGARGALRARERDVVVLREPGGVELSERIRALVKDPALAVDPRAEALLYAAARAQLVAERLRPLLDAGATGAARPLRRLLARLPGRRARARGRGGPRAQRVRHRRPRARPHAAAADRPGGRARADRRPRRGADRLEREDGAFFARDRARLRRAGRRRAGAHRGDRRRAAAATRVLRRRARPRCQSP